MSERLTREELYELVWAKPRTQLAQEMGVSDVWIGKQCRALDVPMPPRGYWANLAAGAKARAKYRKPALTYTLVQRIQAEHATALDALRGFEATAFEKPVPQMPAVPESIDEAVARYASLARGLLAVKRGSLHHAIVQRLLAEDERRAAEASSYSWHQPVYRGPDGPFLLKLLDAIAWQWTDCGFDVSASRAHDVELYVSCGGYHCRFEVRPAPETKEPPRRGRAASPGQFQLWFDRERDRAYRREPEVPALVFDKTDKSIVPKATSLLLARWEKAFRDGVRWRYENAAQERQRAIRAAEEAARRERERLEAEARALLHKRQRLMMQASAGLRRSDEIRALVAAVEARASADGIDAELVMAWKSWVLAQADRMDLRLWPASELGQWLESFDLRPSSQP
jgi:hypothetical protein